ncbi:hypothetical protein KR054_006707 [Drosophila jambulina]|nr:hypothetical protein KR054_006707 [Drosophila jambulina]
MIPSVRFKLLTKIRIPCKGTISPTTSRSPKALQFNSGSDNGLGSDGESQNSDDVYEFNEQQQQLLKKSRVKSLPCSCQPPSAIGSSSHSSSHPQSFSLVEIKQKIAGNSYVSLAEFNYDISQVIQQSNCDELDIAYKELLSEQFPWFQNETKACTDALEEDMFESCSYEDLQDGGGAESASVYNEHSQLQTESRSGVLDIPLEMVDDLGGSCGIKTRGCACFVAKVARDENTEEEPQQQADLLPPEIKDAILEDLPHELLDGISMLDIFMYEDLADKTDLFAISDQSKDGTQAMSSSHAQSQSQQGQHQVNICDEDTRNSNTSLGNGGWPASNPVEDAMLSAARNSSQVQMLKTLAWPKLDGNSALANAIKRRKLSKNLAEGVARHDAD